MSFQECVLFIAAIIVLVFSWKKTFARKRIDELPPGPSRKPIIGNLLDLPASGVPECLHWLKHKERYVANCEALGFEGPLSSIEVFGQVIIIINDRRLSFEILEKNSAKHSSRPRLVFADELYVLACSDYYSLQRAWKMNGSIVHSCSPLAAVSISILIILAHGSSGWGEAPSSQDNTNLLRAYRRAIFRVIGTNASASKFDSLLELEARRFTWRVLHRPQNFVDHIRTNAGAFILKVTYGYNVEPHGEDPLVGLAELALQQFSKAIIPGAWLVDHVPEWFPGAGFKKIARNYSETLKMLVENPFSFSKYMINHNNFRHSFVSSLLNQGEDENIVKWASMAMYSAGADTVGSNSLNPIVSAIEAFFLAMVLYPDIQRKAQEEIDSAFDEPTLPTMADKAKLPYINAMVKEVLRWHTVTPLGVPHKTDCDDVVNGMLIPKGALSFNNDPLMYPDPSTFRPERFLFPENSQVVADPHSISFGFGRRICPGKLIADASLFLTIAHSLAVFHIDKSIDTEGNEINPNVDFTAGIISHPKPYDCNITPRSQRHKELILKLETQDPFECGDAASLAEAIDFFKKMQN
ncbi:hypothetical protein N7510_011802 [Penicillium lagena]|uniref:uncharacterized protein n=1 Tax=Penicillium lagena TaxID=94218 RepID=UPI002540D853|nr:uncharacterized protein N7510_011802 [Penicillium lagena]KAJ5602268.1 hypothetical protein N7510_011802 [Penicillium lagena]